VRTITTAAAERKTTPDAHFHGRNEPTRMDQLRTLCRCIGDERAVAQRDEPAARPASCR
jgi:hypothetical protein